MRDKDYILRILQNSPAILFDLKRTNKKPQLIWISSNVQKILGYTQEEALQPGWLEERILPEDQIIFEWMLAKQNKGQPSEPEIQENHFRFFRKDGAQIWVRQLSQPIYNEAGEVIEVIGSWTDMTELKKLEVSLKEERDVLTNLFDLAPEILLLLDAEGRVVRINVRGAEILGYQREAILGQDWFSQFLPKKDQQQVKEVFARLMAGEIKAVRHHENPVLTASGEERIISWHNSFLLDEKGRPKAVLSYGVDVTDTRKQEEELRSLSIQLNHLIQNLTDGVFFVSPEKKVLFVNNAFTKIFNLGSSEQLIGLDSQELARQASNFSLEPQSFVQRIEDILSTQKEIRREEMVLNDGRCLEVDCIPVFSGGNFYGRLVILHDVTQHKQFEEKIFENLMMVSSLYVGAQKLGECLDLQEVANQTVRSCIEIFKAKLAWLGKAEPDGRVSVLSQFPEDISYPREIVVRWDDTPEGQGPAGRAIRSGFPEITEDIASNKDFSPWRKKALEAGLRSSAAFPLISRGKTFGSINLYSSEPGFFSAERVDLFQTFAYQVAAAMENTRLFEDLQARINRLEALRQIDLAIMSSLDLRVTLSVVLDQVTRSLGVDAAAVLHFNPHFETLEFAGGRGFRSRAVERTKLRLGEGHAGKAALEKKAVVIPDLGQKIDGFVRAKLLKEENFMVYAAAPMVAKAKLLGVLEIFHRSPLNIQPDWIEFFEALASQAAIALENAKLFADLERANLELTRAYEATIEGWAKALELRDRETEGHTQRVTELTLRLAQAVGVSPSELAHVRRGALLHDIGKMAVPDSILLKPGPLDEAEWKIMKQHPQLAYDWLFSIDFLRPALDIPYAHHEKWDGSGYPRGLKGEQIPLAARIFALADVYDALTSERPYRPAWTKAKALQYIKEQAGKHFDPALAPIFIQIITSS